MRSSDSPVQTTQPAVAYRVVVGGDPTKPGLIAEAGVELATPVGVVHAVAPVFMTTPDTGTRCPTVVAC
jgi:hypothetical protein